MTTRRTAHASACLALFFVLAAGASAPAAAQPRQRGGSYEQLPRASIGVSGLYQGSTTEFDDELTFELHRETGSTDVAYPIDAGFVFDAGAGVRLWRGLGVGVAVSRFVRDGSASTSSSLPHPLFFRQPRSISGDSDGIRREETGVHIQAQYLLPPMGGVQLVLFGGPSVLRVKQDLVRDVNYSEEYPYDTATFTGVDTTDVEASATGFNAGIDVRWMFSRSVGVGGLLRFTRATVDLDSPGDRTVPVDAGGAQFGGGIRVAF